MYYLVTTQDITGEQHTEELYFSISENDFKKYLLNKKLESCDGLPEREVIGFIPVYENKGN